MTQTLSHFAGPAGLADWVDAWRLNDLPILQDTADALDDLRLNEDAVDAHLLAPTIADDPLMTVNLLRHVALLRGPQAAEGSIATITEALVMMGIPPFFRRFRVAAPTVEQRLQRDPAALARFNAVLDTCQRAARLAWGFAVHRQDPSASALHQAALLHRVAELLLWTTEPATAELWSSANDTIERQHEHPPSTLLCLESPWSALQKALFNLWRMPPHLLQYQFATNRLPQGRNVQWAIRLAAMQSEEWRSDTFAPLLDDLAQLLQLNAEHALSLADQLTA